MKNKIAAAKNRSVAFVSKHRIAITAAATATATAAPLIALHMRNTTELNEFLDKHDLSDKYYGEDPAV